jgi:type I restriction enzyme, S subunit
MKRWPQKPLGELAGCGQYGLNAAAMSEGTGIRFIRITDITHDGDLRHETPAFVPDDTPELDNYELKDGDVLIARSGATAGKSYIHQSFGDRAVFAGYLIRFQPDSAEILPRFIGAFLQTPIYWQQLNSQKRAVAQPNVNAKQLASLVLPVPPLAEQERIVKLLDEAAALRKLRAQADRRTANLIPALFHEMFGDPETNPKGWASGQLKEFGAEIRYGLGQPPEEDPDGVPMLRATNVKRGYISEIGLIRVRREVVPVSRNAFLNADDVLVVRSGAYTGDIARVGEKWAGAVAGYDLVVSPKERLTGEFVASYMLSKFIQERYFDGLKLRAAQPHLNSTQVSNTPFICPPLSLQKEFAARVSKIRELEAGQAASRQRLDDLFQSMLHRAFNGGL